MMKHDEAVVKLRGSFRRSAPVAICMQDEYSGPAGIKDMQQSHALCCS